MVGSFFHGDGENSIKTAGYILDIDDEYYYLGDTPEEISQAVKRDRVVWIQILTPENAYTELLLDLEVPDDESKKN